MALLADSLSIWEIGLRWAGSDPTKLRLFLPLGARDNFRNLIDAVLHGHLVCSTLSLEKWHPQTQSDPEFFIRHYIEDVYAVVAGNRFPKKLLKWAEIDRWAMLEWCERHTIPLPEFWFPPGWGINYATPTEEEEQIEDGVADSGSPTEKLTASQRAKVVCQDLAKSLWKEEPEMTIASMVKHDLIQKRGGAAHYADDSVRRWLKQVAPAHVRNKRGRPRKD